MFRSMFLCLGVYLSHHITGFSCCWPSQNSAVDVELAVWTSQPSRGLFSIALLVAYALDIYGYCIYIYNYVYIYISASAVFITCIGRAAYVQLTRPLAVRISPWIKRIFRTICLKNDFASGFATCNQIYIGCFRVFL